MPKPKTGSVQTSGLTDPEDPRAGVPRQTFETNTEKNDGSPRSRAKRRAELVELLTEAIRDHDAVIVPRNSRQAAELADNNPKE